MKSEKGVTIVSLIIYIGVLFVVVLLVGRIVTFLYRNSKTIESSSREADFNKVNLYFLEEAKKENNYIYSIGDLEESEGNYQYQGTNDPNKEEYKTTGSAIRFYTTTDGKNTVFNDIGFIDGAIYYNKAKICGDVKSFEISKTDNNGKEKIKIELIFNGNDGDNGEKFSAEYVMRSQSGN